MTVSSGTVEKALALLSYFTEQDPALRLSELARLSGTNKATTLRHLLALEAADFIERDQVTAKYVLGAAFDKFTRIRQASNPFRRAVDSALSELASLTQETAHVSSVIGKALETVAQVESTRSNRVILPHGEKLPLHATASGIALLAWAKAGFLQEVLDGELTAYTEHTITSKDILMDHIDATRARGFAVASEGFELGVVGVAAPYFGPEGHACGAVAVALPVFRNTPDIQHSIARAVKDAGGLLTAAKNGETPPIYPNTVTSDTR